MRSVAIVFVLLLFAKSALAEPTARFRYERGEGAESCLDEASMRRAVAAQLGYDPFDDASSTAVSATIAKKGARFSGRVDVQRKGEAPGRRELSAREGDCTSLGSAMALTISIAIDPLVVTRPREAGLAPLPAPESPSALPPSPVPPPSPGEPPPALAHGADGGEGGRKRAQGEPANPARVVLGISPRGSLGIAPSPALGFAASVALRWPQVSIGLEGRLDLPARAALSTGGDVNTWVGMGLLTPCAHAGMVLICAVGALGSMQGESRGVSHPERDHGRYMALGARVAVEIPLSPRFALRPELDGLVAVSRPSLELNGRTVWTTPPLSGSLGLGLIVRL